MRIQSDTKFGMAIATTTIGCVGALRVLSLWYEGLGPPEQLGSKWKELEGQTLLGLIPAFLFLPTGIIWLLVQRNERQKSDHPD
jgi:hypothetical protein